MIKYCLGIDFINFGNVQKKKLSLGTSKIKKIVPKCKNINLGRSKLKKNQFGTFTNKKKNNIGHSQIKNIAFFLSYRIFLSHFYLTSNA